MCIRDSIGIIGKYVNLKDAYKSLDEALTHGGIANNVKVNLVRIESDKLKKNEITKKLKSVSGILIPGGFGKRGTEGKIAAIFHIEGAEAIDPDLHMLDVLHSAGLRAIGPVWSRPTIFGEGVPFSFPSSPDIGLGLTEQGIALVKRCNKLKIMLDFIVATVFLINFG